MYFSLRVPVWHLHRFLACMHAEFEFWGATSFLKYACTALILRVFPRDNHPQHNVGAHVDTPDEQSSALALEDLSTGVCPFVLPPSLTDVSASPPRPPREIELARFRPTVLFLCLFSALPKNELNRSVNVLLLLMVLLVRLHLGVYFH